MSWTGTPLAKSFYVHFLFDPRLPDLADGAGAEYVDVSSFVLCFCTDKYFKSRACMPR